MSALTPARPLSNAESAWRVTPSRAAASPTVMFSGRYSFKTSPGCAGLCMRDIAAPLLMIVLVVHRNRVRALESESQSPVPADRDCPGAFALALEQMEPPTRRSHISRY